MVAYVFIAFIGTMRKDSAKRAIFITIATANASCV